MLLNEYSYDERNIEIFVLFPMFRIKLKCDILIFQGSEWCILDRNSTNDLCSGIYIWQRPS